MKPVTRKRIVIGVGIAALAAALFAPERQQGSAPVGARDQAPGASAPQSASSAAGLQLPERAGLNRTRGELFGTPPAPPPPARERAEAPVPVAPPMPYRFAGKVRMGNEEQVLVSKGDIVFP